MLQVKLKLLVFTIDSYPSSTLPGWHLIEGETLFVYLIDTESLWLVLCGQAHGSFKMVPTLYQNGFKIGFFFFFFFVKKAQNFVYFGPYNFVQISPPLSRNSPTWTFSKNCQSIFFYIIINNYKRAYYFAFALCHRTASDVFFSNCNSVSTCNEWYSLCLVESAHILVTINYTNVMITRMHSV